MRQLNVGDAMIKGSLLFERLRRLAQEKTVAAKQASTAMKGYSKYTGPLALGLEAGNAAWLALDPEKRARAMQEFETMSGRPLLERSIESLLNPSETIFASGKTLYDTAKTVEAGERSRMDEINNELLRKIKAHEEQLKSSSSQQPEKSKLADYVMQSIRSKYQQ